MTSEKPKGRKGGETLCGMSADALQRGFDSEGDAPRVADHVAGCDSCSDALVMLQAQRDAVVYLTSAQSLDVVETAVERILTAAAMAGRGKLADLLYEMAKACLVMLPNVKRRIERRVEPRGISLVTHDLRSIAARVGTTASGVTVLHLSDVPVVESNALSIADSCLDILENVEGQTERQCLAFSQVLIFSGKPVEAEALLRELLERDEELTHRDLAEWNIMMALMRQHRHSDAVEFGTAVLLQRPDDGVVLYNLAASYAWLRDRDSFELASSKLASLLSRSDSGAPEWLINLLRHEAPEFATCFDTTIEAIEQRFGLTRSDRRRQP